MVEGRAAVGVERDHVLRQGVEHRHQRGASAHGGEVKQRLETVVSGNDTPVVTRSIRRTHAAVKLDGYVRRLHVTGTLDSFMRRIWETDTGNGYKGRLHVAVTCDNCMRRKIRQSHATVTPDSYT